MERKKLLIFIFLTMTVASACALPLRIQRTDDLIASAAEQTVQALLTENAPTEPPPPPAPTEPPMATATRWPTSTPAAAVLPSATPHPCNRAVFISETVKDGTTLNAGQTFTKSWRLRNDGTCTWNPDYRLVFFSGDQMGGPNSVKLNKYVKPGEQVDLLVDLKAPSKAGTYTGYWRMQADDGSRFAQVFTTIKVSGPPFAVTSVKFSAAPADFTGVCPVEVIVKADITASTAGTVTYQWELTDGVDTTIFKLKSVPFDKQGTKTVQLKLELDADGTYKARLYIAQPNNQWFGTQQIEIDCN